MNGSIELPRRSELRLWFRVTLVVAGFLASGCSRAQDLDFDPIVKYRIATGSPGGTYNQIGTDLNELLAHLDGTPIRFTPIATTGSHKNLLLLSRGEADLALTTQDALTAFQADLSVAGEGGKQPGPRTLGVLYVGAAQFVLRKSLVRSGTMDDLAGANLYPGASGSGTERSTVALLTALDIHPNLVPVEKRTLGYSESADALSENRFDAAVLSGGPPVAALAKLMEESPGEFVILAWSPQHVRQATEAIAGLVPSEIAPGTYASQDAAIPSVGKRTLLVAGGNLAAEEISYIKLALDVSFLMLRSDPIANELHPILTNLTPHYWESTFQ